MNVKKATTQTLRNYIGLDLADAINGPGLTDEEWANLQIDDHDLFIACQEYARRED